MYVFNVNDEITLDNLPEELKAYRNDYENIMDLDNNKNLKDVMDDIEAKIILKKLELDLTLNEVSEKLGINISTLQRKIERYNLPRRYRKNIKSKE